MAQNLLARRVLENLRLGFHGPPVSRTIHTSSSLENKKNFRKFSLGNKRGTRLFKKERDAGKYPDMPVKTDVKQVGYRYGSRYVLVPEMIPELVVPDLTGCNLKPYVSYRTPKIVEDPFTAESLFDAVYREDIIKDFKNGAILEDGRPKEDRLELTAEEAEKRARMTGSDIFSERIPKQWECLEMDLTEKKT